MAIALQTLPAVQYYDCSVPSLPLPHTHMHTLLADISWYNSRQDFGKRGLLLHKFDWPHPLNWWSHVWSINFVLMPLWPLHGIQGQSNARSRWTSWLSFRGHWTVVIKGNDFWLIAKRLRRIFQAYWKCSLPPLIFHTSLISYELINIWVN